MEPGLSRIQAAARLLASGPAHTSTLARDVLGLQGPDGASAAAVFALLGKDPRFSVDRKGVWRMAQGAEVGAPMESKRYAVVDVETTGGSPSRGHRITEVAVVLVENGAISGSFETLVNPGRSIPPFVSRLTGITDAMVARAPYFDDVAEPLRSFMEGTVFVAHNAPFDWRFIHHQMTGVLGEGPEMDQVCTVRLARVLLPELRRRNLDSLSQHFDVLIEGRHRALGDAMATAQVFLRMLDLARERGVRDYLGLRRLMEGGARRTRSLRLDPEIS